MYNIQLVSTIAHEHATTSSITVATYSLPRCRPLKPTDVAADAPQARCNELRSLM
jgi:hypothetical protein